MSQSSGNIEPPPPSRRTKQSSSAAGLLVTGSADGILALDLEQRLTLWNPALERMFGLSPEAVLGKRLTEVFPLLEPEIGNMLGRVFEGRAADIPAQRFLERPTGGPESFTGRFSPVRDPEGRITGAMAVLYEAPPLAPSEVTAQEIREQFRLIARATHDAIWDWDLATNRVHWGEGASFLLGYPDSQTVFTADHWIDSVHPQDRDRVAAEIKATIQGRQPLWSGEYRFRRGDGSYAGVFGNGYLVRDSQGHPARLIGAMMDATTFKAAKEALQESEARMQTLFQSLPFEVWVMSPDGRCLMQNPASVTRWGAMVGRRADEIGLDEATTRLWQENSRRATAGEVVTGEFEAGPAGDRRWLYYILAPVRDGGRVTSVVGASLDISNLKRTEALLKRTVDELARSNAELEHFAYVASHDLQEPLRMVTSFVQLLKSRYAGRLDPDADEFIGFAVDGSARMKQLIDDLLAYSRLGTRAKPFKKTDVRAAVGQALSNLGVAIEENGATVTMDSLPAVMADAGQMVQLFQNLIGNSLKFRRPAPPEIRIAAAREATEWIFSVRDNGLGIPKQYHRQIFEIFRRLYTRNEYPGSGIGLAVCKKIVERHGGRIWVESEPGAGSTVYFSIPDRFGSSALTPVSG